MVEATSIIMNITTNIIMSMNIAAAKANIVKANIAPATVTTIVNATTMNRKKSLLRKR